MALKMPALYLEMLYTPASPQNTWACCQLGSSCCTSAHTAHASPTASKSQAKSWQLALLRSCFNPSMQHLHELVAAQKPN